MSLAPKIDADEFRTIHGVDVVLFVRAEGCLMPFFG